MNINRIFISAATILLLSGCAGKASLETPAAAEAVATETASAELPEPGNTALGNTAIPEAAELPDFIPEGIRKVVITQDHNESLVISYEPEQHESSFEYWKIPIPYGREAVVDTEAMLNFYGQLAALRFEPIAEDPGDNMTNLSAARTTVTVEYCRNNRDGSNATNDPTVSQAKADSRFTLIIGNQDGDGNYFVAFKSMPGNVYLLPKQAVDAILSVRPYGLILKIAAVVNIDAVTEAVIQTGGKEYHMSRANGSYYLNGEDTTQSVYQALYMELQSTLVRDELTAGQKPGTEPLLEIHYKSIAGSAKDVLIQFHSYPNDPPLSREAGSNEELVSVSVNGTETLLVAKNDVTALISKLETAFE